MRDRIEVIVSRAPLREEPAQLLAADFGAGNFEDLAVYPDRQRRPWHPEHLEEHLAQQRVKRGIIRAPPMAGYQRRRDRALTARTGLTRSVFSARSSRRCSGSWPRSTICRSSCARILAAFAGQAASVPIVTRCSTRLSE